MDHLEQVQALNPELPDNFLIRATGRFFTSQEIADHLIQAVLAAMQGKVCEGQIVSVADPFAGDGRLIAWLIKAWHAMGLPKVSWRASMWDLCEKGIEDAKSRMAELENAGHSVVCEYWVGDSFRHSQAHHGKIDICISNPPWERLKPDTRELRGLTHDIRLQYVQAMRDYDNFLGRTFPDSQPSRKFAGWGTNLSRVGLDLCRKMCKPDGVLGIVMPASFLADHLSEKLRRHLLQEGHLTDISYFPAEAKLFGGADVATVTMTLELGRQVEFSPLLTRYNELLEIDSSEFVKVQKNYLQSTGYVLPVSLGAQALALLQRLSKDLPTWEDLEGKGEEGLWAGREIDETRSSEWLAENGDIPLFIKGRMVDRFTLKESPSLRVNKPGWTAQGSCHFERLAWRDVSRPNQKRRVIATLIPSDWVAGNSLGVAHFRDGCQNSLRALLGVFSSAVFEFQLRAHLATGHVSLSSIRKVRIPDRDWLMNNAFITDLVKEILAGQNALQPVLEAAVAKYAYSLGKRDFKLVLDSFPKLTEEEKAAMLCAFANLPDCETTGHSDSNMEYTIHNHRSARLSELDMRMVNEIPEGGNWKNIPESIPSKRLDQIRIGYLEGKGSRSTYYGRLRASMPSYTISTYFNRPGNGCHIHYSQDRVISQREAARLQSFPDGFEFIGPQGIVNTQIGNAVPPLLAYQIAKQLGPPGYFVDLFSGAGGMGLGFKWAGWTPIVANDIEKRFLASYSQNVHRNVVLGSITEEKVRNEIVEIALKFKKRAGSKPLWVLGGPPCQGFSTAGQRRTMDDKRNHLFWDYKRVLDEIKPDGFVFENVTGLLSMKGGEVFKQIKAAFGSVMPSLSGWLLSADEYAIPQRRKRVFLIGHKNADSSFSPPNQLTSTGLRSNLFGDFSSAISVEEALADLPPLRQGEDGANLNYISEPQSHYQAFMRGKIDPEQYLSLVRAGVCPNHQ